MPSFRAQEFIDDRRKGGRVLEAVAPALPLVQSGAGQAGRDALRILKRHLQSGRQKERVDNGSARGQGDKVLRAR